MLFSEPTAHQGPEKPNAITRAGLGSSERASSSLRRRQNPQNPRRRRRRGEGGGGDGDAGEGRGAAVDQEVRGGGAVPASVPEGVHAAGGAGGGGRLPRQPEAGV